MSAGKLLGLEIDVGGTSSADDEHVAGFLRDEERACGVILGVHSADEGGVCGSHGACGDVVGPGVRGDSGRGI